MKTEEYARVVWGVDDILELRPTWTREQADAFLRVNEKHFRDRITELGWGVWDALLTYSECENAPS